MISITIFPSNVPTQLTTQSLISIPAGCTAFSPSTNPIKVREKVLTKVASAEEIFAENVWTANVTPRILSPVLYLPVDFLAL